MVPPAKGSVTLPNSTTSPRSPPGSSSSIAFSPVVVCAVFVVGKSWESRSLPKKLGIPLRAGFIPVLIAAQPVADSAGVVGRRGAKVPRSARRARFGSSPLDIIRSTVLASAPSKPRTTTRPPDAEPAAAADAGSSGRPRTKSSSAVATRTRARFIAEQDTTAERKLRSRFLPVSCRGAATLPPVPPATAATPPRTRAPRLPARGLRCRRRARESPGRGSDCAGSRPRGSPPAGRSRFSPDRMAPRKKSSSQIPGLRATTRKSASGERLVSAENASPPSAMLEGRGSTVCCHSIQRAASRARAGASRRAPSA